MRPATLIAAVIFSFMALGHILRLAFGLAVTVGGVLIPVWLSILGAIGFAALATALWREGRALASKGAA